MEYLRVYVNQERVDKTVLMILAMDIRALLKVYYYKYKESCVMNGKVRSCQCNAGFNGTNCDEPVCTDPLMCGSHGIYVSKIKGDCKTKDDKSGLECVCHKVWKGEKCNDIDCIKGESCNNHGNMDFKFRHMCTNR